MKRWSCLVFLFGLLACSPYRVVSNKSSDFSVDSSFRRIGIGFFEVSGTGHSDRTQRNFYDAIAFALEKRGFAVTDSNSTRELMGRLELPADRLLLNNEILRFAGNHPARLLLQGRIEEVRTDRLVESHIQSMVQIHIHDMRSGKRLGEIVLFGKDLDFLTAREVMDMADRISEQLDEMIQLKK